MPSKLKKLAKMRPTELSRFRDIYTAYFLSLGLDEAADPGVEAEIRESFLVRFGRPDHRRQAWAAVRGDLRESLPQWVFEKLDFHFSTGSASRFLEGFQLDTLQSMRKAIGER